MIKNTKNYQSGDVLALEKGAARGMGAESGAQVTVQDPPYKKFNGGDDVYLNVKWTRDGRDHGQMDGGYDDADFFLVARRPSTYLNGLADYMHMTPPAFKVGDRVKYVGPDWHNLRGEDGTVTGGTDTYGTEVLFDNRKSGRVDGRFTIMTSNLKRVDPPLVSMKTPLMGTVKKQERFVTAYKDGPDFALTGDNAFNTQRDADNHANELAANEADVTVVVLKVVSQHSSRIVVTTEHAA